MRFLLYIFKMIKNLSPEMRREIIKIAYDAGLSFEDAHEYLIFEGLKSLKNQILITKPACG